MPAQSSFNLLKTRRFMPFFLTQFFGAFNDNVYKNALIILIAYQAASGAGHRADTLINLAAGLFILPFFLFSATAGQLADKYEKSRLIRYTKVLEIVVMAAAGIGFYLNSIPLLLVVLFCMGAQSTLFGPVKYGILPQHLHDDELVGGNGLVEGATFVAILLGTLFGGFLIAVRSSGPTMVTIAVLAVAVLGYLSSTLIPRAEAAAPALKINWNIFTELRRNFRFTREDRTVFLSVVGLSWFWYLGATYLTQLPHYTRTTLGGDEHVVTILLTVFSVGIGVGSVLCERLSDHKIELGLVPFGTIGLTLFGIDVFFAVPQVHTGPLQDVGAFLGDSGHWRVLFDLAMLGLFGGFYTVPLYALVQRRSPVEHRSRIIAGNNIVNAAFMVVAAIVAIVLLNAGLSVPDLLLVTALLNVVFAIVIYGLVPEFFARFIVWAAVSTRYRVSKRGVEHVPEQGGVVLVCKGTGGDEALAVASALPRPVRFVADWRVLDNPAVSFVFAASGAVVLPLKEAGGGVFDEALGRVVRALANGELVCVFTDRGGDDGAILGAAVVETIVERAKVPLLPVTVRVVRRGAFGRPVAAQGSGRSRGLRRWIELTVGEAMPPREIISGGRRGAAAEPLPVRQ